jgi:hypothetical protein
VGNSVVLIVKECTPVQTYHHAQRLLPQPIDLVSLVVFSSSMLSAFSRNLTAFANCLAVFNLFTISTLPVDL